MSLVETTPKVPAVVPGVGLIGGLGRIVGGGTKNGFRTAEYLSSVQGRAYQAISMPTRPADRLEYVMGGCPAGPHGPRPPHRQGSK